MFTEALTCLLFRDSLLPLKMATVLPGISHSLVTEALLRQSLNPVIISQPGVLRPNVENVLHWQLLDSSPIL